MVWTNFVRGVAERMEKVMTNPIKIVVLSSYNALVEEFMYRGVKS